MSAGWDAIVVGAGHNGLVAAAYLARAGHRVLVVERRTVIGGATVTEEFHPGFRADTGSHRFLWLHPEIERDLDLATHGLTLVRPDPAIFAPLPDGRALTLHADPEASRRSIAALSPRDAARWPAFVGRLARFAAFLRSLYDSPPPAMPPVSAAERWDLLRLAARARRLGATEMLELLRTLPMSVAELLDDWFETDGLKGALAGNAIVGLCQGPLASGTVFLLLHGLVGEGTPGGVVLPRGGMRTFVDALAAAAGRWGAVIRSGARVKQVRVENGRAVGVVLEDGEELRATRVLASPDPRVVFTQLLRPEVLDPDFRHAVRNLRYRGVCARVNLALDRLPDFSCRPGHGPHLGSAILISPSIRYLERAYDDAKYGRVSSEPYLEAIVPSVHDPSLAPSGRHVMSVLAQYVPYELQEDVWDAAARERLADRVIATLTAYAPDLPDAVLARQTLAPPDLEGRFGLSEGNIHHGEMALDQLLFMRPVPGWSDYRTPIDGLFVCGAGAHPGGGVSGIPGRNAALEVLRTAG